MFHFDAPNYKMTRNYHWLVIKGPWNIGFIYTPMYYFCLFILLAKKIGKGIQRFYQLIPPIHSTITELRKSVDQRF